MLASGADWAWPVALRDIFRPRGVNLLVAESADEFVSVIRQRRIHTAIIDSDCERCGGPATIKIIRMNYPILPCIMLTSEADEAALRKALGLDVFAVVYKPVDMDILQELLNRLFMKKYASDIFANS